MMISSEVAALLTRLDEVDRRLRGAYRELGEELGSASTLRDLHVQHGALAQEVGLALLAIHRTPGDAPPSKSPLADSVHGFEDVPSSEEVEAWKRSARERGIGRVSYEDHFEAPSEAVLENLMAALGPPRRPEVQLDDELAALDAISSGVHIQAWTSLPRRTLRLWLALIVARARCLGSIETLADEPRRRVKLVVARLTTWSREHRPGHIHGLRTVHEPEHQSWFEDAERRWRSLRDIAIAPEGTLPPIRWNVRRLTKHEHERATDSAKTMAPDWPLWPLVRGRRALMLGGDPREPNRARLERLFELASLDWPDIEGPRRTEAVIARIRHRTVDLVVVLQAFVDHSQSELIIEAAKANGVTWVLADGYGASAIVRSLERFHAKTVR